MLGVAGEGAESGSGAPGLGVLSLSQKERGVHWRLLCRCSIIKGCFANPNGGAMVVE